MTKIVVAIALLIGAATISLAGECKKIFVISSIDRTHRPCYVILPEGFHPRGKAVPWLVSLHSWSGDLEQRNKPLEEGANDQGGIYLFSNSRGANDNPDACGCEKAQQDILDAVRWAKANYPIDNRRVYMTGVSGGGHEGIAKAAVGWLRQHAAAN